MKVQLTSNGKLRILGEKQGITGGKIQFQKEFPIPANCNTNEIYANFVEGIIYIKLPKTKTTSAPDPAAKEQEKPKPVAETPSLPSPPPDKLPKPTTTTAAADPQLKNSTDDDKIAQQQQGPSVQPSKAQTTKDQTGDAIIAQQQKPQSQKEKQPSKEVGNNKSEESKDLDSKKSSAAGADNARNNVVNEIKAVEKEKNDKLLVEEKKKSTGAVKAESIDESHGKLAAEKAAKTDERGKTVSGGGETGHGKGSSSIAEAGGIAGGKSGLEGLVAALKMPRRLMNLAVVLLFVVVFILYAKDAIFKSFKGESKRSAEL